MVVVMLRTDRLILRPFRNEDSELFAAMNRDPLVAKHLPSPLTREQSDALLQRIIKHWADKQFGPYAVEIPNQTTFAGFVGLWEVSFEAKFTPCIEIAWRMAPAYWGNGYVTEAACAVIHQAFSSSSIREIVSFTVPANTRSWRVMERIGMERDLEGDFEHPNVVEGSPLRQHMLYRLTRERYERLKGITGERELPYPPRTIS